MILNGAEGSVLKNGCSAHGRLDAYFTWKLRQTGGSNVLHRAPALLALPLLWILSRSHAKTKRG